MAKKATNPQQISKWRFVLASILLTLVAMFMFEAKDFILMMYLKERQVNQLTLGYATEMELFTKSGAFYKALVVDTGLQSMMRSVADARDNIFVNKIAFERKVGNGIDAMLLYMNMMFYRFYEVALWVPLFIALAVGASLDAYMMWRREQWRFSFTSPFNIAMGFQIFSWSFLLFFAAIGIPLLIPALAYPILFGAATYGLWLWGSNLQKRL
jgi:hypothetical protein